MPVLKSSRNRVVREGRSINGARRKKIVYDYKICLLMQENEAKKSVQVLMIKKRKVNLRSYTGSEI
jgi:hypothetical protein